MGAEQAEQFAFLGGEFFGLIVGNEHLFLGIESEFANLIHGHFFALFALHASQNSFNAHHQFLHAEGFGDIVVGTDFKSFQNVFFQGFGSEENDRHLAIDGAHFLSQLEAVFFRHHNVEYTNVVFPFQKSFVATFAICIQIGIEALCLQIFSGEHAKIFIVFAQQNS